jgi:hypothetical protein
MPTCVTSILSPIRAKDLEAYTVKLGNRRTPLLKLFKDDDLQSAYCTQPAIAYSIDDV